MEVKATAKYVRVAPSKARQVIRHIKGLDVAEARRVLQFSPQGIAGQILKTLDSAIANAEHNEELDADDLVVTHAYVDEGPTLRRFRPRAMGRAYRIRKRTSHITVMVGVREVAVGALPGPAGAPPPTAATQPGPSRASEATPSAADTPEDADGDAAGPEANTRAGTAPGDGEED